MKRSLILAIDIMLTIGLVTQATAQFKDKGVRLGMAGGLLGGLTTMKSNEVNAAARIFLRHNIADHVDGDLSGSFGQVSGHQLYQSTLYTGDYMFLYKFGSGSWEPYAGLGVGLAYYVAHNGFRSLSVPKDDAVLFAPVTVGVEHSLSDAWTLDANAGFQYALSNDVVTSRIPNSGTGKANDAWLSVFLGISYAIAGDTDADNDGLKRSMEKQLGTDPTKTDTDDDGISDGDEVTISRTNPLTSDSDGDGLSDGAEVNTTRTNPLQNDSDGDGLTDGEEVNTVRSDPLKKDTDGDGLTDGDEVNRDKTNPNKADSDADGLSDLDEVSTHMTNPLKADSDDDGLSDKDEIALYRTSPMKPDTDNDGLSDSEEIQNSRTQPLTSDTDGDGLSDGDEFSKLKTDPLRPDTDGDGFNDGIEQLNRTNPVDPKDPPKEVPKPVEAQKAEALETEVGKAIVLEGVMFKAGSSTVLPESEPILSRALSTFLMNPSIEVEIRGYTDNTGNARKNVQLSAKRAEAVKTWLMRRGIPGNRITAKGYGSEDPVASNATADGRAKNRRIEFFRLK